MDEIKPNTTPAKGKVAIFYYKNVKHVALITDVEETGFIIRESNFHAGTIGTRFVPFTDPHLTGFYSPDSG